MLSFTLTAFVELMDHGIVSWDTFSVAFIKKVIQIVFFQGLNYFHRYFALLWGYFIVVSYSSLCCVKMLWMWGSGHLTSKRRWHCLPTRIIRVCMWEPTVKGNQSVKLFTLQKQSLRSPCTGLSCSQDLRRVPSVLLQPFALNQVFRERQRGKVLVSYILGLEAGI